MRMLLRALLVIVVGSTTVFVGSRADACHQYLVTAKSPVDEGEKITVLIERDDAAQDSSVQLRTVDGTAKAGSDYKSTIQRITFTGAERSKTIQIPTIENTKPEPTESFLIKLSGAQGCSVDSDFDYGNPEPVSIKDDDASVSTPTPTRTPGPATNTPAPASTARPKPKPDPTPTDPPTPSETPTPFALPTTGQTTTAPSATPATGDDDDLSPLLVGLAVGAIVLAAGLTIGLSRRRGRYG